MPDEREIREAPARSDIQVALPDGRILRAPLGATIADVFRVAYGGDDDAPVAAIVDSELRELACPLIRDVTASPVRMSDSDGMRIYSRSLSFLLVAVAAELFPSVPVHIDYSVPHGGYFCRIEGREPFTPDELARIKTRMLQLVREDQEIVRRRVAPDEVRALFAARGEESKARQLLEREGDHLHVYVLNGVTDYFYGYMVASTGVLKTFSLETFPKRLHPALPAAREPAPSVAAAAIHRAARGVRRVRTLALRSRDARRQLAERRDARRPHRPGHPRVRGAAREANRRDRRDDLAAASRRDAPRVHRRAVVVGEDDLLEAPRDPAPRQRRPPLPARARRLLPAARRAAPATSEIVPTTTRSPRSMSSGSATTSGG